MPQVNPTRNEVYLCTGVSISSPNRYNNWKIKNNGVTLLIRFWITGFHPQLVPGTVHHMAVAGCSMKPPNTNQNVWNCGANGNPVLEPQYPSFVVEHTNERL